MSFHNVLFPENISYGSRGGPKFNSNVVQLPSGKTYAESNWEFPLHTFDAKYGVASQSQMKQVIDFIIGREGPVHSFKFKDWRDYASTASNTTHLSTDDAVDEEDVVIGVGDNYEIHFQVIKKYVSGSITRTRNIYCLAAIIVALDGVLQTETTDYSVDYNTGVITFVTAPAYSVIVSVGYEFYVKCKFAPDIDNALEVVMEDFDSQSLPSIPIIEDPDGTVTEDEFFYGGGTDFGDIAGGMVSLSKANGLAQVFNPTSGLTVLKLPLLASVQDGGPHFVISHAGGAGSLGVKDNALASTLKTLTSAATIMIYKMGTNWYVI
jgi:uncharacterized protein (TIGR02217 family)